MVVLTDRSADRCAQWLFHSSRYEHNAYRSSPWHDRKLEGILCNERVHPSSICSSQQRTTHMYTCRSDMPVISREVRSTFQMCSMLPSCDNLMDSSVEESHPQRDAGNLLLVTRHSIGKVLATNMNLVDSNKGTHWYGSIKMPFNTNRWGVNCLDTQLRNGQIFLFEDSLECSRAKQRQVRRIVVSTWIGVFSGSFDCSASLWIPLEDGGIFSF